MKLPVGHVPGVGVHKPTAYGGLGEKLLRGWGWEAGRGCGKDGQGMTKAIEVQKKDDNAGIGGNNGMAGGESANVQSLSSRAASDSDSSTSGSDSESEDETQLTTCQAGILRNRDGTVASASAAELKIAAAISKDARGWAGRFGGREGKMERIRRQEAAAAERARIELGLPSNDASVAPPRPIKMSVTVKTSDGDQGHTVNKRKASDKGGVKPKKSKKDTSTAQTQGSMSAFTFAAAACSAHVEKKVVEKDSKWWGCNYFVSAGYMAGLEPAEEATKRQMFCEDDTGLEPADEATKRQMFCEDDQENLYNRTQNNKAAGRQGIGVRGSAIKISGGKYEGTKVKFDDVENDAPSTSSDLSPPVRADSGQLAGIKWKKLITNTLNESPHGVMKAKKLQRKVAAEAQTRIGATVCLEHLKEVVMQKVTGSSRFVVEGKQSDAAS
eukprot:CAMPEP_0177790528 /NCGR_PEP_ID=MMETSP0491_2-20121128/23409_1 /TAXON_ID=63592 /ORGANISM="Tetraselmis chuii, Strain PLY429" /LENGTH=440 /DNA_ID=CAMNT_0019312621 /DNA_START=274 /DNA_END=1595 /DNA_ORIENTATION=+